MPLHTEAWEVYLDRHGIARVVIEPDGKTERIRDAPDERVVVIPHSAY